jgi:hypothetical protein
MIISIKSLTFSRNRIYQASSKSDKFKKNKTKQNKNDILKHKYICVCVCVFTTNFTQASETKNKKKKETFFPVSASTGRAASMGSGVIGQIAVIMDAIRYRRVRIR